jgi:hypothetical protein
MFPMRRGTNRSPIAALVFILAAGGFAAGQGFSAPKNSSATEGSPSPLFDFQDSEIKFSLRSLMNTLRDSRHEGWVLAAYPDPKTGRPLIGAGFSLDVTATDHPQYDPLNPHPFVEPSSVQLWQAAGLDPAQLRRILDQFDLDRKMWSNKMYRRKIRTHTLTPQLTEEEGMRLLRVSSIQAVENAKAYCRDFDDLTGPQQMALSQLVFQMGVNLEEFVEFLSAINGDTHYRDLSLPEDGVETEAEHWHNVQRTLIESEWARRYASRASTVIAMFDPGYIRNPQGAVRQVEATLRPPAEQHRRRPAARTLRASNESGHRDRPTGKRVSGIHSKRKLDVG